MFRGAYSNVSHRIFYRNKKTLSGQNLTSSPGTVGAVGTFGTHRFESKSLDPSEHRDFKFLNVEIILSLVTYLFFNIYFKIIHRINDFTPMVLTSLKNIF